MPLTRRAFLQSSFALAATAGFAGCACPFGGRKTQVALQLYSVRGLMKDKDGFRKTLKAVRDIGYAGVEFAGYGGFTAPELKQMLDDLGLQRAGTHLGLNALLPNEIQKTLDFNLAYGNRYLMVPWANAPKDCKDRAGYWKKLADDLSAAAETAAKSGSFVGYHNHQHEFRDKIAGVAPFQILFDRASPRVCMQLDVGHVVSAGEDPVAWFTRYPVRSRTMHAKEVYGKGGATGVLGQPGTAKGVDWPALYKATDAEKVDWYIVECESNPNTLEHVKASFDFLRAAGRC